MIKNSCSFICIIFISTVVFSVLTNITSAASSVFEEKQNVEQSAILCSETSECQANRDKAKEAQEEADTSDLEAIIKEAAEKKIITLNLFTNQLFGKDSIDITTGAGGSDTLISEFFTRFFKIILTFAAILAVISIAFGGFKMIYSSAIGSTDGFGEAKSRIGSSIFGIGFLLLSFLILKFINPNLVSSQQANEISIVTNTTIDILTHT